MNSIDEDIKVKVIEMVKPRKPTPLSKDRKPSAPVKPGIQKRQRPNTAQYSKPTVTDIYGRSQVKTNIRQELMGKNIRQTGNSTRGVAKPKWKN